MKRRIHQLIREWILSFAFRFRKSVLLLLILFFCFISKQELRASIIENNINNNWDIEKGLISEDDLIKTRKIFINIKTAMDLENLIRYLGDREHFLQLQANYIGNVWHISGKKAQVIKHINFILRTRRFKEALAPIALSFIGKVNSKYLREKIHLQIKQIFAEKGFPKAIIDLNSKVNNYDVTLNYTINPGYPCIIESVSTTFKLNWNISLDISKGDICNKIKINNSINDLELKLSKLGYSQIFLSEPDIIYNSKLNTAKVLIKGNIGKKIKYNIIDNQKGFFIKNFFSNKDLYSIDPNIVGPDALASDLAARYAKYGYDDVIVTGPDIKYVKSKDLYIYTFNVNPGPRYKLTNIEFQGASVFSEAKMLEIMHLSGIWQSFPVLNIDLIRKGIEALKSKYMELGYWDIRIQNPRITKDPDTSSAQMTIVISEGLPRILNNIIIHGNTVFSDKDILDLLSLKTGQPLNKLELSNIKQNLENSYLNKGYLYANTEIKAIFNKERNRILSTLKIFITEDKLVKIGNINIFGLTFTKPIVILRELQFKKGDPYNPEMIDLSRSLLLSLGLFKRVQIIPSDSNAIAAKLDTIDILIDVRESKPGTVIFGPGWSLYRGMRFGIESSYNNIGGYGRQLYGRAYLSEEANQKAIGPTTLIGSSISLGYVEPYVFNIPINTTLAFSYNTKADEKWTISSTGDIIFSHKLRSFLTGSTISVFYGQKINKEISSKSQEIGYLRIIGGNIRLARIGLRYTYDHRNDISWPTKGFILNTEASAARYSLGGDIKFNYWKLSNSHYFKISNNTVIAAGVSFSAYKNITRKGDYANMLPVSETIHVGGADTVRGFSERSLGPIIVFDVFNNGKLEKIEHENIGGSHSAVYKLELRYQLIKHTISLTTFIDSGNSFFTQQEIDSFNNKEAIYNNQSDEEGRSPSQIIDNAYMNFEDIFIHPQYLWSKNFVSYGLGVSYLTPLGSINISYGIPWHDCVGDSAICIKRSKSVKYKILSGQVHINIGTIF